MKPNSPNEGLKWNAPSHGDPTSAWLATKGFVPKELQRQPLPKQVKSMRKSKR